MKITLDFDVEETDDAMLALKAKDLALALYDFKSHLRSLLKYPDSISGVTYDEDTLERLKADLFVILEDRDINLDSLIK